MTERSREEGIIDNYINERLLVQQAIDHLIQNADHFVTFQMLPNFKMALYRLGTDRLASIIKDKYGYYFEEQSKTLDAVIIFVLTEIFGNKSGIVIEPKNDEIAANIIEYREMFQRFEKNFEIEETNRNYVEKAEADAEKNIIDEEEAEKRVTKTPSFSKKTQRIFGSSITALNELSNDREIQDIDKMIFTGNCGYLEAVRYIQIMPEFKNLFQLGSILAEEFAYKLRDYLKRKNEAVDNDKKNFINVIKFLFRIKKSYDDMVTTASIKRIFLYYFFDEVFSRFFRQVFNEYSKEKTCDLEKAIDHYEKLFLTNFFNEKKSIEKLTQFFETYYQTIKLLENSEKYLKKTFGSGKQIKDDDLQYVEDEVQLLLNSRTLPCRIKDIGGFKLHSQIPNRRYNTHFTRQFYLATLILEFSPPNQEIQHHIDLAINRYSGDIILRHGLIPLSEFMDKETYRGLKMAIYEFLFETLLDKEEDIDEIETRPITVKEITSSQIQDVLIEKNKEVSLQTQETIIPVEQETHLQQKQKKESSRYRKLSGLDSSRVRDVLTKLLGSPITQSGSSHFRYRRKNSSGTYPIPIHPSRKMPAGTLIASLEQLGIDVDEFLKEY